MKNTHELANVETHEYCTLNVESGEKAFSNQKNCPGFTGLYYKSEITFFGIYPSTVGPKIYYQGQEYSICKNLTISLTKEGKHRRFCIKEYNILIEYEESPYIGIDVWSEEIDIDLFFMIAQRYRSDDFYKQYTISTPES